MNKKQNNKQKQTNNKQQNLAGNKLRLIWPKSAPVNVHVLENSGKIHII